MKAANVTLDLSYSRAATILTRQPEGAPITIVLAGCGGTGSYFAEHIGRVLLALGDRGTQARAVFVDHDVVEEKNIGRQLFCRAEIGLNKAAALALRYGTAWGLQISARAERFVTAHAKPHAGELVVIVGAVDNAAARKEISKALTFNRSKKVPDVWWLDAGNHEDAGQVLLGSSGLAQDLKKAFPSKTICQALPSPALQSPELLKPKRAEKGNHKLSCAELTAANLQSLTINARVAAEASDFLTRLLVTRNLKRFACEINLAAGSMRSTYATPEAIAAFSR